MYRINKSIGFKDEEEERLTSEGRARQKETITRAEELSLCPSRPIYTRRRHRWSKMNPFRRHSSCPPSVLLARLLLSCRCFCFLLCANMYYLSIFPSFASIVVCGCSSHMVIQKAFAQVNVATYTAFCVPLCGWGASFRAELRFYGNTLRRTPVFPGLSKYLKQSTINPSNPNSDRRASILPVFIPRTLLLLLRYNMLQDRLPAWVAGANKGDCLNVCEFPQNRFHHSLVEAAASSSGSSARRGRINKRGRSPHK